MQYIQHIGVTPENLDRLAKQLEADKRLENNNISVTWPLLAVLEPNLEELVKMVGPIKFIDPLSDSDNYTQAWLSFKTLVGYGRLDVHPILSTQKAYDIAYEMFLNGLPASDESIPVAAEKSPTEDIDFLF